MSFAPLKPGLSFVHQRLMLTLALLALAASATYAQSCPQLGIQHSSELTYPQIARGAHVSGLVTLVANFGPDGTFSSIGTMKGPAMFLPTARSYVESWRVTPTSSAQTCDINVDFRFEANDPSCEDKPSTVTMADTQHFTVSYMAPCIDVTINDPAYIRHQFLFLHWRSTPKYLK